MNVVERNVKERILYPTQNLSKEMSHNIRDKWVTAYHFIITV